MTVVNFDQPSGGTVNSTSVAFSAANTGSGEAFQGKSQTASAVHGDSTQSDAVVGVAHAKGKSGVLGVAVDAGVYGVTGTSQKSVGVHGMNGAGAGTSAPPTAAGVWGESDSGHGVHGESAQSDAVLGIAHAQGKTGVLGIALDAALYGVTGMSPKSTGVHGMNGNGAGVGAPPTAAGVWGESDFGHGVHGESGQNDAVLGIAHAQGKTGVLGIALDAALYGVTGMSSKSTGVHGMNGNGAGVGAPPTAAGVWGESDFGHGVHGESAQNDAVLGIAHAQGKTGVLGIANAAFGNGVTGMSMISHGVHGMHGNGAGMGEPKAGAGVWGESDNGYGVWGASSQGVAGHFEGIVEVTGDIRLLGSDCAENFDVDVVGRIEPGTVVVIGEDGRLSQSRQAYDRKVAGVVSGAGDYAPGLILDSRLSPKERAPVALVGKVYCKADAEYSPIEVGDLLTTSPTPGHAMNAVDRSLAFGAVLGKALRPLRTGRGLIPILVALQ